MADLNEESREVGFDAKREAIEYWTKEDGLSPESTNDITVKVSADVSEAITGFKALSREIREVTKAIREYEAAVEDVPLLFDKDGNLTMIGAEFTVSEAQSRKESRRKKRR